MGRWGDPEVVKTRHGSLPAPSGYLWVACWCSTAVVAVPRELVGRTTYECGRKQCGELRRELECRA